MFADEKKVRVRRIKRQLKAAASIVVALAAGTFLACKQDPPAEPEPNPKPPEEKPTSTPPTASVDPLEVDAVPPPPKPSASMAIVPAPPSPKPKPTVDKKEHRKGMPVPDNLLE